MNQKDYYHALRSRKQELEEQIKRKRDLLQTPLLEATDELSGYDQHPGDVATDTFEREKEVGLLDMLEFEMKKLNEALDRCKNDSYGTCEECGKAIEAARLERMPNTTICAVCARSHPDHYTRPVEEEVIRPSRVYDTRVDIAGYSYNEHK